VTAAHERGPVWALVNCAVYVPPYLPLEDLPFDEWQRCFRRERHGARSFPAVPCSQTCDSTEDAS